VGQAAGGLAVAEHRREFDRRLDVIEAKVIELFAMVCEDLPAVTQAVLDGTNEVAGPLAEREQAIDALYREIERLGDHAVNIARRVIYLAGSTHARPLMVSR
jgi:phosphate uptake regulator